MAHFHQAHYAPFVLASCLGILVQETSQIDPHSRLSTIGAINPLTAHIIITNWQASKFTYACVHVHNTSCEIQYRYSNVSSTSRVSFTKFTSILNVKNHTNGMVRKLICWTISLLIAVIMITRYLWLPKKSRYMHKFIMKICSQNK